MNISSDTPVTAEDLRATAACVSKSDRMRVLAHKGYATARIAEALGVRYQFVRNVLTSDVRLRRTPTMPEAPGMAERAAPAFDDEIGDVLRLSVEEGGLIRLPPEAMARLGLRAGSIVITLVEADRLVLLSGQAAARRVQSMVAAMNIAPGRLASEELIQERRAETAREGEHG